MARSPRLDIPGIAQHVVQRGNNRLPCFLDDEDRQRYLQCLRQALLRYGCHLHAYVLMSNHVHLLMTPQEKGAVSRLMHTFSRNYVGLFNGRHGRTGTLWEGRFKSCLVDSDGYFLACSRYIELNPVRAWMVAEPGDYAWSSYRAHAEGCVDPLLTAHSRYFELGANATERAAAYKALFADALPDEVVHDIHAYLQQQKALGTDRFRAWVEARTQRFATIRPPGRPTDRSNGP